MTDKPKPIEGEVFGPGDDFVGEHKRRDLGDGRVIWEAPLDPRTAGIGARKVTADETVEVHIGPVRYSADFSFSFVGRQAGKSFAAKALAQISKRIDREVLAGLMGAQDVTPKPAPKNRRLK